jgi:para-aminobenzoate synthetase component I
VHELELSADEVIARLLALSATDGVCILDSCGISHLGSHLLIAGIRPAETIEIANDDPYQTLSLLDSHLSQDKVAIFTFSYDLGLKLARIAKRRKEIETPAEPDVFLSTFDCLVIHDYNSGRSFLSGDRSRFAEFEKLLRQGSSASKPNFSKPKAVISNFTRDGYVNAVEEIKELIRSGDTYQTNLTQRFDVHLNHTQTPQDIFARLRKQHPAPFASFIRRTDSTVVSASPERFFSIDGRAISTSPIKGTRRRGNTPAEDESLKKELVESKKDRAENTMIVDLLRNDLGRVCEYGSVEVEKLCDLEEHPTLLHLVSTIGGKLRSNVKFSDVIKAIFPCGSITGAPKHRTMQIIDRIETADRGLSMGAIGISIPAAQDTWQDLRRICNFDSQLSVAIRTMVIRDNIAAFNVGGGITIDSDPDKEYEESLLKAKALLTALGVDDGNSITASGV